MSLVHAESNSFFNHAVTPAHTAIAEHSRPRPSAATVAIHGGQRPDGVTGSIVTPIHQTSTYVQRAVGQPCGGFTYSRAANPTVSVLEEALGELDAPRAGQPQPAVCFATGLAASSSPPASRISTRAGSAFPSSSSAAASSIRPAPRKPVRQLCEPNGPDGPGGFR